MAKQPSKSRGEGARAYLSVYNWLTATSGQARQDKFGRSTHPGTPRHDSGIADAIDQWLELHR